MKTEELTEITVLQILERFKPSMHKFNNNQWTIYIPSTDKYSFPKTNAKKFFNSLSEAALFILTEASGIEYEDMIESAKNYILVDFNGLDPVRRIEEVIKTIAHIRKLRQKFEEAIKKTEEIAQVQSLTFWKNRLNVKLTEIQMQEIGNIQV